MKRCHAEDMDGIKRRCVEKLSVKRKLSLHPKDVPVVMSEYEKGIYDGKRMAEDAFYYYFTYYYNSLIKTEVDSAVDQIKDLYENIIASLNNKGQGLQWVH